MLISELRREIERRPKVKIFSLSDVTARIEIPLSFSFKLATALSDVTPR